MRLPRRLKEIENRRKKACDEFEDSEQEGHHYDEHKNPNHHEKDDKKQKGRA